MTTEPLLVFHHLPYPMEFNPMVGVYGQKKGRINFSRHVKTFQQEVCAEVKKQLPKGFTMIPAMVPLFIAIQPFKVTPTNKARSDADSFVGKYLIDALHSDYGPAMKQPELRRAGVFENDSPNTNMPFKPLVYKRRMDERPTNGVDLFIFELLKFHPVESATDYGSLALGVGKAIDEYYRNQQLEDL